MIRSIIRAAVLLGRVATFALPLSVIAQAAPTGRLFNPARGEFARDVQIRANQ